MGGGVQTMVEVLVCGVKKPVFQHWAAERREFIDSHSGKDSI